MEGDKPIELLVSRVWNGTKWHYPNIERMVEENNRLRAELVAAIKQRDEARRSVCEMSIQLGGVFRCVGGKTVEVTTPEGCAEIMRWDCFKENTDDR